MSYNYYRTTILRLVAGMVIALCGAATMSLRAQEQQVITIKTKFNVGDSVYMKVVSKDAVAVQATGLSSAILEQDWRKYKLTAQTVTVTGPVKYLATFKNGVTDITFEHADYLDRIDCEENELTQLDFSNAPQLTMIFCHKNKLTSLDISKCEKLTWVNCSENKLSKIDLANKPALKQFVCSDNPLSSFNTSGATALRSLECTQCGLTTLNLSANKNLQGVSCGYNQLSELTMTGCTKLNTIYCERNKLQTLDLSTLTALQNLKCYLNEITALDFSGCPSAHKLYLENNKISKEQMLALAKSLPTAKASADKPAQIAVYDESYPLEENVCNKDAVQVAQGKNWSVLYYTNNRKYAPYSGADAQSIDQPELSSKPIVYPTVTSGTLYLTDPSISSVACYTMAGELLFTISNPGSTLDVSTLPEGAYVLQAGKLVTRIEVRR